MKTFYVTLILSVFLLVGGFFSPPMGVIDGSILSAVGLLLAFATLSQVPQLTDAIRNGKSFRFTKGDLTAEVTCNRTKRHEKTSSSDVIKHEEASSSTHDET